MLVEAVRGGGPLGHLADGDLLLAVDGTPVATVEAVQKIMERAERKPRPWCEACRGIRTLFVELQSTWATEQADGERAKFQ